jgi:hypothetical protein
MATNRYTKAIRLGAPRGKPARRHPLSGSRAERQHSPREAIATVSSRSGDWPIAEPNYADDRNVAPFGRGMERSGSVSHQGRPVAALGGDGSQSNDDTLAC